MRPQFLLSAATALALAALLAFTSSANGSQLAPGQQPPSNTSAPSISGTAQEGQTLTADPGAWSGVGISLAYQWQRCSSSGGSCANVAGATSATDVLGVADVAYTMRVVVTATNKNGSTSASSPTTALVAALPAPVVAPASTSAPTISGTVQQGQTLTAGTGSWRGTQPLAYAYQWQRCNSSGSSCAAIAGAITQTYLLGSGDVGSTLRVAVTASNSAGSATATSAATGAVTAAASPGALTWKPPALTNPITVQVSNSGLACPGLPNQNPNQPWACVLASGQDYILKVDHRIASATDADGLTVTGGNNVVIIGGQVTIPAPSSPTTPERYSFVFHWQTGTVHVEGVLTDGYPLHCYVLDSAQAIFQFENDRCQGTDMYLENWANPHSDILTTWKSPPEIRVDKLTAEYDNTGLALYGQQQSDGSWTYPGHVTLKRVNLRGTPAGETQCSNYTLPEGHDFIDSSLQTRIDVDQLYVETGWGRASLNANCPAPGSFHVPLWGGWPTYNGQSSYTATMLHVGDGISQGSSIQFTNPATDNIWGPNGAYATVNYGVPSGGDYVPAGLAGPTYTSPGYTG